MTRFALLMAEGFEDCEALITVDMLRRGRLSIDTVSWKKDKAVCSSHGVVVQTDLSREEADLSSYDVLILPGGKKGTANLEADDEWKKCIRKHMEAGKRTCAICAAPSILGHMGLLKGRKYTCFPDFDDPAFGGSYQMELAVEDGNLITGRGMGATIEFARLILKNYLDEQAMDKVEYGIQYEHSFRRLAK